MTEEQDPEEGTSEGAEGEGEGEGSGNGEPTIESLTAENASLKKALRKANREAADRRHQLKQKEGEEPNLQQLQTENNQLKDQLRAEKVKAAVHLGAVRMNFHNPSAAYKLVDLELVDVDEKGEVVGVEDALKALVASDKYLIKQQQGAGGGTDAGAQNTSVAVDAAALEAKKRAEYGHL